MMQKPTTRGAGALFLFFFFSVVQLLQASFATAALCYLEKALPLQCALPPSLPGRGNPLSHI